MSMLLLGATVGTGHTKFGFWNYIQRHFTASCRLDAEQCWCACRFFLSAQLRL